MLLLRHLVVSVSLRVSMFRKWLRSRQRIWSFRTLCCICVWGTRRLGWFYCRCSSCSCFVWCRRARGSCTVCFWSVALALPSRCPSSEYSQNSLVRRPHYSQKPSPLLWPACPFKCIVCGQDWMRGGWSRGCDTEGPILIWDLGGAGSAPAAFGGGGFGGAATPAFDGVPTIRAGNGAGPPPGAEQ